MSRKLPISGPTGLKRKRARRPFLRYATVYVIRRHQTGDASAPCHSLGGRPMVATSNDFVVPIDGPQGEDEATLSRRRFLQHTGDSLVASPPHTVPDARHHSRQNGRNPAPRLPGSSEYIAPPTHPQEVRKYGTVECEMGPVVCRYHKGRRHRHGIQYW